MAYKPGPNQPDIKHDVKRKGALTNRADHAGKSVNQEAEADKHASGLKGEQARYYLNVLKPATHGRKHSADGPPGSHWSGH